MGESERESMTQRCGYVLLAGLPNAGKSTLLNALVGEHLSIVTSKAQTTWQRVAGIRTERGAQMIFLDTPGVLATENMFQRAMLAEAKEAAGEADVAVCIIDGARPPADHEWSRLEAFFSEARCPTIAVLNKSDLGIQPAPLKALAKERLGLEALVISADSEKGLPELLSWIRKHLPEGPFLYPEDDLATVPTRFFVQELIRETIFELYHEEIPYSTACQIEEFREDQDPIYIGASVYVERKSQKGILVGNKGSAIREVGVQARKKVEHFLGRRVYLDLWVKVLDGWRRKKSELQRLGYTVFDEGD